MPDWLPLRKKMFAAQLAARQIFGPWTGVRETQIFARSMPGSRT